MLIFKLYIEMFVPAWSLQSISSLQKQSTCLKKVPVWGYFVSQASEKYGFSPHAFRLRLFQLVKTLLHKCLLFLINTHHKYRLKRRVGKIQSIPDEYMIKFCPTFLFIEKTNFYITYSFAWGNIAVVNWKYVTYTTQVKLNSSPIDLPTINVILI